VNQGRSYSLHIFNYRSHLRRSRTLATQVVEQEEYERNLVREKKHRFRDVYPLNPELHKKFEEEQKNQAH